MLFHIMRFLFKKIHHLIRYFILLGLLAFVGYRSGWNDQLFFLLMGPPIYLADNLKTLISDYLFPVPSSAPIHQLVFLLPVTLLYFIFIGFQLKQLWNERGLVRTLSLLALIVFLGYIHFWCWQNLLAYYTPLE